VPLGPATSSGNGPWDTVERLEDGDVVLVAMFYPAGESPAVDASFRPRDLPLSADDAQPGGLEGQPDHIYAERLGAQVNGWNMDLLIFYGGTDPTGARPGHTDPSAETVAAAQEQLARRTGPRVTAPELPDLASCRRGALRGDSRCSGAQGWTRGEKVT
jgi:hypothetical protein